jgi:multidrug efflux pump subunit AcrB
MNLAKFSIEKSRITLIVLFTIVLMGIFLYGGLARDSMPPYTVRVASIISNFPGASPERVEQLVTDKIEQVAQELPELKEVTSTSRTNLSIVTVTLKNEVSPEELQSVWDRLRRKLNTIQGLPQGVEPKLEDDGVGDVYGIIVGLSSDGFSYAEMKTYADKLRDEFIRLSDAAKVELGGVQEERVFIEYDNSTLRKYNLTSDKLRNTISSVNIVNSGGKVYLGEERIILEPTGNFRSLENLKQLLVSTGNTSQPVYLGDITRIKRGYISPPNQLIRINGKDAISIHINLKQGANIISLGKAVNQIVEKWQNTLPIGLELQRLSSLDDYIDYKINDFINNLIQSVVIVLLVMLVFLGIRTGTIIASLIPIVNLMTMMLMGLFGVGLNQVTLAALIMALGMMVDNAIVVAETIMVKVDSGESIKKAAIDACAELFVPLLISTLTTSVAFLSFYLAESTMGDIVGPIFVVITMALLSSWFIALSVITLFCVWFLKGHEKNDLETKSTEVKLSFVDRAIRYLKGHYKNLILVALKVKVRVFLAMMVLFVLSLFGFTKLLFVFFPDSDRNMITVDVNLPLGTRIEKTENVIRQIEQFMMDSLKVNQGERQHGVLNWSSYIGKGPESYDLGYSPDEANSSYGHILVNTSDASWNNAVIEMLDQFCFLNLPNADVRVGPLGAGGGGVPVEFKILGEDPGVLAELAEKLKLKLVTLEGTKNVKDDWGPKGKKFVIQVDQARAQVAGITNLDIASALETTLDGERTGEYREGEESIPIIMKNGERGEQTIGSLQTISIFNQNGNSVPLAQVATVVPEWEYAKIRRLNQVKTITISSELTASGNASLVNSEAQTWLENETLGWPEGYSYEVGGDAKNTAENMGAVIQYLPLSGFIIVLLLVIQFNSFRKVTMVLATIPLGVIGVVIGLAVFQEPFGFMPFLGVISLAGIVINNAIVLIDRVQIELDVQKRTLQDAIIVACLQRFRPIVLATLTTILGLIPLYLNGGELWEGMAVAIMVGLLFGTLITLIFIPVLYSILYRVHYHGYKFNEDLLQ